MTGDQTFDGKAMSRTKGQDDAACFSENDFGQQSTFTACHCALKQPKYGRCVYTIQ